MAEYIERETAYKALIKDAVFCARNLEDGECRGYIGASKVVKNLPAADVAPVRHGHWIDCEDDYSSYVRCSVCGDEYTSWEADCAKTDFCPGCGARMDGAE